jgi:uncharacterized protein (DUF1501 family)
MPRLARRRLLAGTATVFAAAPLLSGWPRAAFANVATERRLVVVVLRGGMDGLAAVPAYGDPHYQSARAGLALPPPGSEGGALPLDTTFALHPKLTGLAALYRDKMLLPIHATCVAYHGRSHFEAQNVLENGSAVPYLLKTGWLNRALAALPDARPPRGIAIAQTMPVIMRGDAVVTSWFPSILPQPNADTLTRVAALYATDPKLADALAEARMIHATTGEERGGAQFAALMGAAGRFLAAPNGPRVAMLESTGWDTHANEAANYSALDRNLGELDRGVAALKSSLGAAWTQTVVFVATEFGRTVAMNGTHGTDHGTGGAALLFGGAVAGGRVLADWPGLGPSNLFEQRDLKATLDLRGVLKGVLADHLGVPSAHIDGVVFPDSATVKTIPDLIRTA